MSKSILLVGNGGSLKDSNLGKKIDEFDEVIRINEGKTKGWEQDAGMKFTIWATFNPEKKFKKHIDGYRSRGYSDTEIQEILKGIHEVWYVAPRVELLKAWHFDNLLQDGIIIRHLAPRTLREISRIIREPTTGFMLIYLLSKMYDKFYITGFDFLGHSGIIPKFHHYFTDTPLEPVELYEREIRDLDGEYAYTKKLIDERKILQLTNDTVIEKSEYIGTDTAKGFKCGHITRYYWWENDICNICESR